MEVFSEEMSAGLGTCIERVSIAAKITARGN